jgi:hypothetical protein
VLGDTVAHMFVPCMNIRAGAEILTADYLAALITRPDPQTALKAALSAYNTGDFERGFFNGYVAKYYGSHPGSSAVQSVQWINPYTANPTVYHRSGVNE